MTKELEVKVLNIDKELIQEKLVKLGAKLIKIELQTNIIFMDIDKDIEGVGKGYLRLRQSKNTLDSSEQTILTFKTNISQDGFRENQEIETVVENKDNMIKILSRLNINIKHIGEKQRIRYEFQGIKFDIDTWDKETYPQTYMEIEFQDPKDIKKALKLLDLKEEDLTTESLSELRAKLRK